MADGNVNVAHTTILRWVQRYVPEFAKCWQRYARPVGRSWRIDETYSKIKGTWAYLYRGVDKGEQTIDFFLSARRDIAAAKRFLQQAIEKGGVPQKITLDGYAASHVAVGELHEEGILPAKLTTKPSPRDSVTIPAAPCGPRRSVISRMKSNDSIFLSALCSAHGGWGYD